MTGLNVMGDDLEKVVEEIRAPKKSASYEICESITQEIANMRKCNHMSQRELADRSGVKQQMIARFESGINTPNMSTVLKLLASIGKTLYIGDMKNVEIENGAESAAEVTDAIVTPTGASIGNESLQKIDITE